MRRYYLFKLKETDINLKKVYAVLEELFYLNSNKFKYGISAFNDLCLPIDKDKLIKKLSNEKITILENTTTSINNISIVVETNKNFPKVFKYINELENNLIVCDFENKDYFLLDSFIKLNFKLLI